MKRDILKARHARDRPDDDIVVSIKQDSGCEPKSDTNNFPVLFDVLPQGALVVARLASRVGRDLGDLFALDLVQRVVFVVE